MKKNLRKIWGIILSLGLFVGFSGCKHNPVDSVTLTGITLDTTAVKTEFTVGDTFTTEGLIVFSSYSDEKTKKVVCELIRHSIQAVQND